MFEVPYTLETYADGSKPAAPIRGTDTVCRECLSKPDVRADYHAERAVAYPDGQTRMYGEKLSCTLCGIEAGEIMPDGKPF